MSNFENFWRIPYIYIVQRMSNLTYTHRNLALVLARVWSSETPPGPWDGSMVVSGDGESEQRTFFHKRGSLFSLGTLTRLQWAICRNRYWIIICYWMIRICCIILCYNNLRVEFCMIDWFNWMFAIYLRLE